MAGSLSRSQTFVPREFDSSAKNQKRWEQAFPGMRCVQVTNPELRSGESQDEALKAVRRLEQLGYQVIPLDDQQKYALLDTRADLLMGCTKERHQQNIEAERKAANFMGTDYTETLG